MRPHVDPTSALNSGVPSVRHGRLFLLKLFLFPSLALSQRLSLSVCIDSRLPVKVLSIIALILTRHSVLCGFVALPCNASAAHPAQPRVWR